MSNLFEKSHIHHIQSLQIDKHEYSGDGSNKILYFYILLPSDTSFLQFVPSSLHRLIDFLV
jgi:hypothetical protein